MLGVSQPLQLDMQIRKGKQYDIPKARVKAPAFRKGFDEREIACLRQEAGLQLGEECPQEDSRSESAKEEEEALRAAAQVCCCELRPPTLLASVGDQI